MTLDKYFVVSFVDTSYTVVYITIFYSVLAWYFDNFYPANRGISKPWYFPLNPSYWLGTDSIFEKLDLNKIVSTNAVDTAKEEAIRILQDEKLNAKVNGVRAICLSKSYKDNHALKGVSFEVSKGQLLGVMGHNGAGKSTLINCLCGLVTRNYGNAKMFDYDINHNLRKVRKRLGVVSQFDVLWDELTGIEHMQLF